MKLLLLLFYHLYSTYVFASNDANCGITDISDAIWQGQLSIDIGDNQINEPIFTSKYKGTIDSITCPNLKKFFAVEKNITHFIIATTAKMETFDEETKKINRKFSTEIFRCLITCNNSPNPSTLSVFLKITDINTHPPTFYQKEYTFLVPSPLMSLTDFSIYGIPIVVTDLDFSNQDVSFTIDPDDFDIKTLSSAESKDYTAQFFTKKPIEITEDKVYKLTATDSGDNPHTLSSSITVKLKSNTSSSIDFPSFKENSYEYSYSIDEGPKLIPKNGGEIIVKSNKLKDLSDKSFNLVGDLSQYLTPVYNSSSQTINFKAKKISTTYNFLLSTLTVKTDNIGSTTIVVYMPTKENEIEFNSHIYNANYNKTDKTITVEPSIKVQSRSGIPVISISGEHSDYFQIDYNSKTKSYDYSLSKDHTIDELGNIDLSKQLLTATLGKSVDRAQLLLRLPKHELKFTKSLYMGSYDSVGNNIYFDTDNLMKFTTEVDNVDIIVDKAYTKYFSVHYDSAEHKCDFKFRAEFPKDILVAGKDLIITVTAEDKYKNKDQSNVKIVIPSIDSLLEFADTFYQVDYPATGNEDVDLPIRFKNPKDLSKVSVTPTSGVIDAKKYFSIGKQKLDQYVMHVINKLPEEIEQRPSLVLTLVAKMSYAESTATLVVNMPTKVKEPAIEFKQILYTGKLEDGKLSIDNIEIVTSEKDSRVWTSIEESKYSKYFQASYKNKLLTVSVNESAPEEELKAIRSTLLTIDVGISETKDQTSAVLSLKSNIQDDNGSTTDGNKGAYIATISILTVALVVFIVGSATFYKLKIRNRLSSHKVDFEDVGHVRFDKKAQRKPSGPIERKSSEISQRRPTGFIFDPLGEEIEKEISDLDDTEAKERRKSVAFDENVQELQIESTNEEGDKSDVKDSDKVDLKQTQEGKVGSEHVMV